MKAVRFFGPLSSHTGYGNAVANFAKAFAISSVNTKFQLSPVSDKNSVISKLNNYEGKTEIDFYLHCPPYNRHKSNSYKVGYFYWEADRLPRSWSHSINQVDELWVPCELVKEACIASKYRGEIKVIPTPCNDWTAKEKIQIPSGFSRDYVVSDETYKFYSIFQWQNRKNWKTLLRSYYKAFSKKDDVILILKVNPLNIAGHTEDLIRPDIINLKRELNLKYYPPIYLSSKVISSRFIKMLHNTGDCYVAPHHGEGWGMPIHDAMRMGKQIVTTKYGGVTEYLDNNSAHIINHNLGPVSDMEWSHLYGNYQRWAYPSELHLSELLKDVYINHKKYKDKGTLCSEIANSMSVENVSKLIEMEIIKI